MAPPPPAQYLPVKRQPTIDEARFLLTMLQHTTGGNPNGFNWATITYYAQKHLGGTDDIYATIAKFNGIKGSLFEPVPREISVEKPLKDLNIEELKAFLREADAQIKRAEERERGGDLEGVLA